MYHHVCMRTNASPTHFYLATSDARTRGTMPKKGKKNGRGKGKGKKGGKKTAAKAAAAAEAEEMLKACKKFIKSYQLQCASTGSVPSQRILKDIRACVENERPLPKVTGM